jgi:Fe-S-cluster-containing dehydrogenase component
MIQSLKGRDNPAGRGNIPPDRIDRLKKGDVSVLVPAPKNLRPTPKVLVVDPLKCNGCGLCEIACVLSRTGDVDVSRSRIHVIPWNSETIFLPVCCQHCAEAPCRTVCPKEAIYWDEGWGRVMIDYDRCVSCRQCAAACPYGAIGFDEAWKTVFKCDLCNGNPQCVSFCEPRALTFIDAYRLPVQRLRQSAGKLRRY